MRNKLLKMLFVFIRKNYLPVLCFSLFLGIVFFICFRFIPLKSNYVDLLPQAHPAVITMNDLTEKLKGVGQFSIVIRSKTKNIRSMQETADYLAGRLSALNEIQHLFYKLPLDFFKKNFFFFIETEDLAEIYQRLHEKVSYELWSKVPVFINLEEDDPVQFNIDDILAKYDQGGQFSTQTDYLISRDQEILVIFLKPDFMPTEADKTGALIQKIEKIIANYPLPADIETSFAGSYKLTFDQKNSINNDIKLTSMIALLLIFLAILLFVRNLKLSLFLLLSLGLGVLSVFALAYLALGHINLITGFLIAILTGLGVNYGIHYLMRYQENLKQGGLKRPLFSAFISTGKASITGATTTAISFFTLIFSQFLGFSEFGLLSSFGIIMTLIAIYIVVTSLIFLSEKLHTSKPFQLKEQKQSNSRFSLSDLNLKKIIFSLAAILVVMTLGLSFFLIKNKLQFEYNSKKLEVKNQSSILTTEMIQQKFNISTDPAIYYTYNREEEIDFFEQVKAIQAKEGSSIGSIMSISRFVPTEEEQLKKIAWIKKINRELSSFDPDLLKEPDQKKKISLFKQYTRDLNLLQEEQLPLNFSRRFLARHAGKTLYITQIFPNKVLFDAKEMEQYVAEIETINGKLKKYYPTGLHILYVYLIQTILKEGKIFISIVFIIIWLLLLFDFKNIKDATIAIVPLVFGILWLLQIMSIFQVKFNFMNIIVLPIVLGTGVDNGVHLYHRYKESGSIYLALKKTGLANFVMSFTVALGWMSLFFAHYQGLKTMAFVGCVGIMLTFIASITIMPALIILFSKKKAA